MTTSPIAEVGTLMYDGRTCRERQDAAIADLWERVDIIVRNCADLRTDLEALQERVKRLESMPSTIHPNARNAPLRSKQIAVIRALREVTP